MVSPGLRLVGPWVGEPHCVESPIDGGCRCVFAPSGGAWREFLGDAKRHGALQWHGGVAVVIRTWFSLVVCLVLMSFALSGCFESCNAQLRTATWVQEGVPATSGGLDKFRMGDFWGGAIVDGDSNEVRFYVYHESSVSQAEMDAFAEAMFAERSWPTPSLAGAEVWNGCGDHY